MTEKILVTRSSMPPYEEYIEAIKPLWDTHWLTNMGVYHKQLEQELREYLDVPQLSLMVNGHAALELAIQSFEFAEGSEVITTPFTFISTTHAILRNHLKPVFCDVKLSDGTIDETKIEALITDKTVAIVPVHVYGNACNVEEIQRIAEKHHLKVIYDAAHAFGVKYKGHGIGSYGDASIFSFHATKVFNTIEGGAIAFSDSEKYKQLKELKNFGIGGEELVEIVGTNAKMNEFCAIMGLCNLKHIEDVFTNRKKRTDFYTDNLLEIPGIRFFNICREQTRNHAYFPILIAENREKNRDAVFQALREKNIYARKYFFPLTSDQSCFHEQYKGLNLKNARSLARQVLTIPIYDDLSFADMEEIVKIIKE